MTTAKSIVIDVTDTYTPYQAGIRSVEFYLSGVLVALSSTDFSALATDYLGTYGEPGFVFDTSLSKIGDAGFTSWFTDGGNPTTNIRLFAVFNTPIDFDKIIVNNFHENGGSVSNGVQNIKVYSTGDTVTSTVYGDSVSGYELLYDDALPQHASSDAIDDVVIYEFVVPTMDVTAGQPVLGTPSAKILLDDPITIKTLIIDIADAYGVDFACLRSVELYLDWTLYALTQADFAAYATNFLSATRGPEYAFDTTVSKVGDGESETSWISSYGSTTNLRLSAVLDTPISVNSLVLNNFHNNGADTTYGIENIKIYALGTVETSTVYGAGVTESDKIFDGILAEHVSDNIVDDQALLLIGPGPSMDVTTGIPVVDSVTATNTSLGPIYNAKSVILDFADNYGGDSIGIRSIEFYFIGELFAFIETDFVTYATSYANSASFTDQAFDTVISKTGDGFNNTSWVASAGNSTNQRLIVVFDDAIEFDKIEVNNFHNSGGDTTYGAQNTKIYTSKNIITNTVYDDDIYSVVLIFDGVFIEHPASDAADNKELTLLGPSMDVITGQPVIGSPLAMLSCAPDNILTGVPIIPTITGYTLAGMTDVLSGVPIVDSVTASIIADETFDIDIAIPVNLSLISGTGIDIALPSFNLNSSCYSGRIGDVDITFPSMSLLMKAGNNICATLPVLTLSGTLSKEELINIFCQLPSLQASLSSSFSSNGDIEANLVAFQMTMSSLTGSSVDLSGIFPKFVMINTILNGTVGDIDMTLPMIQAIISSIVTGDNDLEAIFPGLLLSINADKLSHYALNYVKGKVR